MERFPLRPGRVVLAVVALAAGAYGGWARWVRDDTGPGHDPGTPAIGTPAVGASRVDVPDDQRAPAGVRVRVQVLNATRERGLARRATFVLRDRGFDVVETGTSREQHDSTLVIHLAGDSAWAARVANALGGARVVSLPDTSRYLDVSVLIGTSWRPPAEPFYP